VRLIRLEEGDQLSGLERIDGLAGEGDGTDADGSDAPRSDAPGSDDAAAASPEA
jgi:hypothetical protein